MSNQEETDCWQSSSKTHIVRSWVRRSPEGGGGDRDSKDSRVLCVQTGAPGLGPNLGFCYYQAVWFLNKLLNLILIKKNKYTLSGFVMIGQTTETEVIKRAGTGHHGNEFSGKYIL